MGKSVLKCCHLDLKPQLQPGTTELCVPALDWALCLSLVDKEGVHWGTMTVAGAGGGIILSSVTTGGDKVVRRRDSEGNEGGCRGSVRGRVWSQCILYLYEPVKNKRKSCMDRTCLDQGFSTWGLQGSRISYSAYQTFTLWFITAAKLQLWGNNEMILWLEVTTTRGIVAQHS